MHIANKTLHNLVFIFLLAPAFNIAFGEGTHQELPPACQIECSSPYGTPLGKSPRGIEAYSNCRSDCVVFEPNQRNGTYTGIKWQCVEYARRWLLINTGTVLGDVDIAADLWGTIDHLTDARTKRQIPLETHLNGSAVPPAVGDLLIYAKEFKGTGHVAVVTRMDIKGGTVEVSEQNFHNELWTHDYARKIELLKKRGKYWLLDGYLLGWKHPMF
jgi:hypothetical protein